MRTMLERRAGTGVLTAAVLASLCLAGAARAASAGGVDSAGAAEARTDAPHRRLMLTGYADGASGRNLLAGRYEEVIAALARHDRRFNLDQVAASTNLCVAYIMTHRWDTAHAACDEAVELARLDVPDFGAPGRAAHDEQVALAYSNRGVLAWLEHRASSAADDLAKAHALAPASRFVARNLAVLRVRAPLVGGRVPRDAASHG